MRCKLKHTQALPIDGSLMHDREAVTGTFKESEDKIMTTITKSTIVLN
jgi:hypothetical protein